ncbi:MAG: C45 family peptidase [Armatimonadota bacterium]
MWTIAEWYREGRARGERDGELIRNRAGLRVELMQERGPENVEETVREMMRFHTERFDAVPDLNTYPELRGMRELLLAEMRGVQEGAGLDDTLTAAYFSGYEYYHRKIASRPKATDYATGKANCSCIYFPTSDRGPLLANNLDSSPKEAFGPPAWPLANEHLVIGGVSSGVYMDEESPETFPAPVFKLVGRYCRDAKEAVEMMTRYNYFWGPGNMMVIDRQQQVAMVEKSACRIGVRWSPDGFGFITAMTAEEPGMHAYLADRRAASIKFRGLPDDCLDAKYWEKQDQRHALMNELLDEARKNPTLETMRKFIQFRDPRRGNVCGFGEPIIPGGPDSEFTIRTSIWELGHARAHWWAQEGMIPSWENPQPDVEFTDVLLWE